MNHLICAIRANTKKILLSPSKVAPKCYRRSSASIASLVDLRQRVLYSTRAMDKMGDGTATIAIGQMRSTNDKQSNRDQVQEIVKLAVQQNASFVFLPECCDYIGTNREEMLELAEPLSGETVSYYKELARTNNVWLSLGGIHESIRDKNGEPTNKLYNAHVVVNSSGEVAGVYRKLHLFDVETPEFNFRESQIVAGGNSIEAPLTDTPLPGGLALLICYDLQFAELSTILRKRGANFLTYPSAFAHSMGLAHWESLLRARAIENQCFVIAPAQIGIHNEKRQSYGHAMVVDPWGKILVECENNVNRVQCKAVTIDVGELTAIRQRMPCFEHRRNDVYSLTPIQKNTGTPKITTQIRLEGYSNECNDEKVISFAKLPPDAYIELMISGEQCRQICLDADHKTELHGLRGILTGHYPYLALYQYQIIDLKLKAVVMELSNEYYDRIALTLTHRCVSSDILLRKNALHQMYNWMLAAYLQENKQCPTIALKMPECFDIVFTNGQQAQWRRLYNEFITHPNDELPLSLLDDFFKLRLKKITESSHDDEFFTNKIYKYIMQL